MRSAARAAETLSVKQAHTAAQGEQPAIVVAQLATQPDSGETQPASAASTEPAEPSWAPEAERELGKIPFFVRGKAKRNTEQFAQERGVATISIETLYEAKAHFSR